MNNICRNCKHWGADWGFFSVKKMLTPTIEGGHGWKDREEAIKWVVESRTKYDSKLRCKCLEDIVEVEIDQGSGWDAGGASVDEVCTPGDFGCNKFEHYSSED